MLLPAGDCVVDDLLMSMQEALSGVAHGVERPGLDERLDRALVEHRGVAPLAEIVEVRERTVGVSLSHQTLNQTLTHVADRRETEHDATSRPLRREPGCDPVRSTVLCIVAGIGHEHRLEVGPCHVHVGHRHLDAQHPTLVQVDSRLV